MNTAEVQHVNFCLLLRAYAAACPPELDAFVFAASETSGIPRSEITTQQRTYVKQACFGLSRRDLPVSLPTDPVMTCAADCGETPHRWRPSPEVGLRWVCSDCGCSKPTQLDANMATLSPTEKSWLFDEDASCTIGGTRIEIPKGEYFTSHIAALIEAGAPDVTARAKGCTIELSYVDPESARPEFTIGAPRYSYGERLRRRLGRRR